MSFALYLYMLTHLHFSTAPRGSSRAHFIEEETEAGEGVSPASTNEKAKPGFKRRSASLPDSFPGSRRGLALHLGAAFMYVLAIKMPGAVRIYS